MKRWFKFLITCAVLWPTIILSQDMDIRGVGFVNMGAAGGCTGTLIAPDLVLTAGHCMLSRIDGERMTPEQFSFHPATVGGAPGQGFIGAHNAVHPVFLIPGLSTARHLSRDIALLKLAEPVPAELATPIDPGNLDDLGEKGFVISFRGENSRARQRACEPISISQGMLQLGCQVKKGESGSPFLAIKDGKLSVIGVISASSKIKNQPIALAALLQDGLPGMLEAFEHGN